MKDRKVGVIGLGYVGLPLVMLFVEKGFAVVGVDVNQDKVKFLVNKKSYLSDFQDKDIEALMNSQRFNPSTDFSSLSNVEAIVVCVPTPLKESEPDLTYIFSSIQMLIPHLKSHQLIVLESSTYPGTTEEYVLPMLEESGYEAGINIFLSYSPERIDPGNKEYPLGKIPKIISGVTDKCLEKIHDLYGEIFEKVVPVSTPRVAEFAKMLENSQRLINISFINEINLLANKMKIDLWEVIEAAKTKPMGFTPYYPGAGIGGHCIPVDPFFLSWIGMREGILLTMIQQAGLINNLMPHVIVGKVSSQLENLGVPIADSKIGVVGITYKKDVNDIRESPSLKVLHLLKDRGADVKIYDPVYLEELPYPIPRFPLTPEEISTFDLIIILVDHSHISWDVLIKNSKCIIDTKNVTHGFTTGNIIRI